MKIQYIFFLGGVGGGGGVGSGVWLGEGLGRCEQRSEVFVKIHFFFFFFFGGGGGGVRMDVNKGLMFLIFFYSFFVVGGGGSGRGVGGQGRCEQRSEVFVTFQKKNGSWVRSWGWGAGSGGGGSGRM